MSDSDTYNGSGLLLHMYKSCRTTRHVTVSDCGCDDECRLHDDCCFPDRKPYVETRECVYFGLRSYYTITSCPGQGGISCWNFNNSAPWGSLMPFFSLKDGTLYLNKKCALCNDAAHVADEGLLTPRISCGSPLNAMYFTINEMLKGDGQCHLRFFPDEIISSRLCNKQCNTITVDRCTRKRLDSTKVVSKYGLSFIRMKQLCLSNYTAPFCSSTGYFKAVHKNIFCYMCGAGANDKILQACSTGNEIVRDEKVTYLVFLDSSELAIMTNNIGYDGRYSKQLMACKPVNSNLTEVSTTLNYL